MATRHYENFPVASVVLPRRLVPHFHAVYAFCRWADDLGDEVAGAEPSLALLDWWRELTVTMPEGVSPRHPVFVALKPTVREFGLTPAPFLDLISAFEQDQTVDGVRDVRRPPRLLPPQRGPGRADRPEAAGGLDAGERAAERPGLHRAATGQHVAGRGAGRGDRPAVPAGGRHGPVRVLRSEDWEDRRDTPAFRDLLRFEVDRAEDLLRAGRPLADAVGGRFGAAVDLFAAGGLAVCEKLRAIDFDVWNVRPTVTKTDGARLLAGALGRAATRAVRR